jgi:hypothetical protein
MIRKVLIGLAAFAAVGFAGSVYSQATEEGDDATPSRGQSPDHAVVRDAHRQAMQQQMEMIREIEDPEERQRRMDELHEAMGAMREAMMSANQERCSATGEECHHHGAGGQHGHFESGGGEMLDTE